MLYNVLTTKEWEEAIKVLARIAEGLSKKVCSLRNALEGEEEELAKTIVKEAVSSLRKELATLQNLLTSYYVYREGLKDINLKDWEEVIDLLEEIAQKAQRSVDYIKGLIKEGKTETAEDMLGLAVEDLNWDLWGLEDLLIGHEPEEV